MWISFRTVKAWHFILWLWLCWRCKLNNVHSHLLVEESQIKLGGTAIMVQQVSTTYTSHLYSYKILFCGMISSKVKITNCNSAPGALPVLIQCSNEQLNCAPNLWTENFHRMDGMLLFHHILHFIRLYTEIDFNVQNRQIRSTFLQWFLTSTPPCVVSITEQAFVYG